MNEVVNYQIILKSLTEYLEKNLQVQPIQINCLFRENTPIFLIHYSQSIILNPKEVFFLFRQALQEEGFPEDYPVSIYLVWQESDRLDLLQQLLADSQINSLKRPQKSRKIAIAAAITGMTIFSLLCGYALTRPCVIGKCQVISEAKEAIQTAFIEVNPAATDRDILVAQQ